jgi:hypothetical protein
MEPTFKAGQKVKARCTSYYFMGQCREDRIPRGSICIIESVHEDGRLFFREHPMRYGPWNPENFRLVKEQLTREEILTRALMLGVDGTLRPSDAYRMKELVRVALNLRPGERVAI